MSGSQSEGGVSPGDDMLALQATLRGDASGAERDRALGVLETLRASLKRQMDRGVAPAEYRALEALAGSAEAASEVIAAAWRRYNVSPSA